MGVCGGMCLQWRSCRLNRSTHMRNEPAERAEKPEKQGNGTEKKARSFSENIENSSISKRRLQVVVVVVVVVVLLLTNLPDDDCSGLTTSPSACCWRCWCWLLLVLLMAPAGVGCCWYCCCCWLRFAGLRFLNFRVFSLLRAPHFSYG